ncbi:MAG: MFS transporter [Clostridia bacterium]|nr:MFS transporter [Clostridia bacterium]
MKLNYKRVMLVGMAFFLISAFWQAYDAIIPLILTNHFGLHQTASGAIMSIDNVLAVFMLPLFGALSDKVMTKRGRRTPFIVVGAVSAISSFIALICFDAYQVNTLINAGIVERYDRAKDFLDRANEGLNLANASGNTEAIERAQTLVDEANGAISAISDDVLSMTLNNIWVIIAFIGILLVVLIAMATFRSPAVALMPDVTVKPLRSKANAIINLVGTVGGILVLLLGKKFNTSGHPYMKYTWYIIAVAAIMLVGLLIFIFTVKERKWAAEMEEDTMRLGLVEKAEEETGEKRKLSRPELRSLLLILASVALWYIGYNSITSKYSVYATNILGFDYNVTLIIAQAAAIVSYIPVGIIASKIGRRKTILAGVLMLTTAFFIGNFITPELVMHLVVILGNFSIPITPELVMYPVFILAGMGWATINVNSFPMVVELARGGDVGKYTGYYYTASMSAQIVAPILSGLLYDLVGMRYMFFAFGTLFVALSFVTMFFVKHGDSKNIEKKSALEHLDVDD